MKNIKSAVRHFGAVVTGVLLLCAAPVANSTIVYDVNRTIGAGTVTGFVETDGTLGVLDSGNITDWVLTLTAPNLFGGSPDVIDFATQTQTFLLGPATTATSTQLLFDFGANGFFILQGSGPGNLWCLETGNCTGGGLGEHIGTDAGGANFTETTVHSGVVAFANVAVPEPGTLALFGLGLASLGLARRKRAA